MGKLLGYGSIDCTKITKSKMIKNKNNQMAYVNVVIWENDEPDQYGNMYSITESLSKEEKERGDKTVYLGNLKAGRSTPKDNRSAEELKAINDGVASDINPENGDYPF